MFLEVPSSCNRNIVRYVQDEDIVQLSLKNDSELINQMEQDSAVKKLKIYKPQSIEELTSFAAAIRPSFKSNLEIFLNRKNFSYGIPVFDKLIQGEFQKDSFILFQEQIMNSLAFSDIPSDKTYSIIKAISKKKESLINSYKEKFNRGFTDKANCEPEVTGQVWQIIHDASAYGLRV